MKLLHTKKSIYLKNTNKISWFLLLICSLQTNALWAEELIQLNFVNADIESTVRAIGIFTNKTFIIDPRVKGTITLQNTTAINRTEAYNTLLASLRLQGFTIVESGGIARVLPENDAKIQSGAIKSAIDPQKSNEIRGDQIVTQIFQLNYESASNLVPILRPLIAPNNTIAAYPNNNTLIITDYADNLKRLARIIASIDTLNSNHIEIVTVQHALAIDLAAAVTRLLDENGRSGANIDNGQRLSAMADSRTNSILLRAASTARMAQAKALIARLDQPTNQPANVHVVYLKNAEASKLSQTLRAVLNNDTNQQILTNNTANLNQFSLNSNTNTNPNNSFFSSQVNNNPNPINSGNSSPNNAVNAATGNMPSQGAGIVQADPSTNSIIITASEPVYRNIRAIIEKLDVRRAQVFVESLIVEVSADKAAEFGIQFQSLTDLNKSTTSVIGGSNFGGRSGGRNILDTASNLNSVGGGLNIGIIKGQINIPGLGNITNLGFLARALETQSNANILSTPNLLTLDNEEARIVIGQNVPFVTGQYTNSGTGGNINPFQTIERRDVGLTLRVKPQVSEGGTVKLSIYQEVSSVQDRSQAAGIITNKRAIESNIIVDDGNIIVLGGLVEDRFSETEEKVPGLGDIPGLGALFRYDTRKRMKTNLMVFLRPVVLRNQEQSNTLVADRYDFMRNEGQNNQPIARFALPNEPAPILPELKIFENNADGELMAPAEPGKPTRTTTSVSHQASKPVIDPTTTMTTSPATTPTIVPPKTRITAPTRIEAKTP